MHMQRVSQDFTNMLWVNLFRCVMCANLRLPYRRKRRPYGICNDFTDMESVRIMDTESVRITDTESVRITDTESVNQAPYVAFLSLRIRNL